MKVGIVGGRDFTDMELLRTSLLKYEVTHIVSGGAVGADALAEQYAKEKGVGTTIFKPDWQTYGMRAAYLRNKQIVDASDCVVAFWDGKSKGTKMTIDICEAAGKPVEIINYYK